MSFSSSPSSNASLLPPPLPSSNSSLYSESCVSYRTSIFILITFFVTNSLLLLPLCVFILCLCLQRWQRQRSASTATSFSDVFTYHMVAVEMISIFGSGFYCFGACVNELRVMMAGLYFYMVTSNGQIFFHILSCVDRHLAVVHPITYLGLRKRGRATITHITIGCIWLLFFAVFGLTSMASKYTVVTDLCLLVLSILVVSLCSISVLRALNRPGPGGGDKERVHQLKLRAFHTIVAIMGALLWRFGGHLLVLAIYASSAANAHIRCGVLVSGVWFSLPSSLVLPLLFLNRAGKLTCCRYKLDQDKNQSRAS